VIWLGYYVTCEYTKSPERHEAVKGLVQVETTTEKRRKYIGVGGDDVPSLGVLEGDIMRLIWDAGEPQSSVQVYEAMHFARRAEKREMQSPSTIAVTLSRMVEKGLLTVERRPRGGTGYYGPTKSRAEVVAQVMDDVCKRLVGQPAGVVFNRAYSPENLKASKGGDETLAPIDAVIVEIKKLQAKDTKPVDRVVEKY
jgi:predicted transcriptional regulator